MGYFSKSTITPMSFKKSTSYMTVLPYAVLW